MGFVADKLAVEQRSLSTSVLPCPFSFDQFYTVIYLTSGEWTTYCLIRGQFRTIATKTNDLTKVNRVGVCQGTSEMYVRQKYVLLVIGSAILSSVRSDQICRHLCFVMQLRYSIISNR